GSRWPCWWPAARGASPSRSAGSAAAIPSGGRTAMPRTEPPRPDADPAPMPQRPPAASPQPAAPARSPEPGGARYMLQLVQLRWIAAIGQVAAIAYARFVLDIGLPLAPM